jgi:hypothetical protein
LSARLAIVVVAVLAAPSLLVAQSPQQKDVERYQAARAAILAADAMRKNPIRVYAFVKAGPPSEFIDRGSRQAVDTNDSLRDLIEQLKKKKKIVRLVGDQTQADVLVEMLGKHVEQSATTTTRRDVFVPGVAHTSPNHFFYVSAVLTAGDYSTELSGGSTAVMGRLWRDAASDLADNIEKWITDNGAQLLKRRAEVRP